MTIDEYRRALERLSDEEFSQKKAYIIAGQGDYLFDHDERGMDSSDMLAFSHLKRVLGVDND